MSRVSFQTITLTATDQTSSPAVVRGKTSSFGAPIVSYGAALAGYELGYTSDDHNVRRVMAQVTSASLDPADPTKVEIEVTLGINDKNSDDRWTGSADVLVTAELAQS